MITNAEADILLHTSRTGRYVSNEKLALDLGARGLLFDYGPQALAAGAHYLVTTPAGRAALNEWKETQPKPKLPRRRRSAAFEQWQQYRDANGRFGFSDFLRVVWPRIKNGSYFTT